MRSHKRRFSLRVHPAGLALMLLALVFGRSHIALAAVLALLLHEGAHVLMMALCGVRRCEVELTPFGGVASATEHERLSCARQLWIALAGVLMSLACGLCSLKYAPVTPFWYAFANLNLSLALINILPVWPLDGARAVMALASRCGFTPMALKLMRWLAYLLSACLVALGLYGAWIGHMNLSLLLIGPYLCYAARESSLSSGVDMIRRAQLAQGKLQGGAPLPVDAHISEGMPDALALSRMLRSLPTNRYHVLYITNKHGELETTLTEKQIADKVFSDISSE